MAVGSNDFVNTLSVAWDGSTWSVVPSPDPANAADTFNAVSCSGPDFCMAFGTTVGSNEQSLPLAATWDGSSWTVVSSPLPRTRRSRVPAPTSAWELAGTTSV